MKPQKIFIQWTIDKQEFDVTWIATRKESAPGPDGIPCGIYRCAVGLGSHFLFNACRFVVEGGSVPPALLQAGPCSFPNLQLSMTKVLL